MATENKKLQAQRDRATVEAMASIYCEAHHKEAKRDSSGLCVDCRLVAEGTIKRATLCPHGHDGNCQDCDTKCNRGEQGEKIRAVMAYAAPRMLLRHPLMTLRYLRKKASVKS